MSVNSYTKKIIEGEVVFVHYRYSREPPEYEVGGNSIRSELNDFNKKYVRITIEEIDRPREEED